MLKKQFRPHLATDIIPSEIKFPVLVLPKLDGVRGVKANLLLGRSLKTIPNHHCQTLFKKIPDGLEGELIVGSPTAHDACRVTVSGVMSHDGEPDVTLWVFDNIKLPLEYTYQMRHDAVRDIVTKVNLPYLKYVPAFLVSTLPHFLRLENEFLAQGYEGVIVRDPQGVYKYGRSTVREGGFLRVKRFVDDEGIVIDIIQGHTNENEKTTNELGLAKRSSHKANMKLSPQVGALIVENIKTGDIYKISPGKMTKAEREYYFQHPDKILGLISKHKHFPKGVKDKPRLPTHQSFRDKIDL